DPRDAVRLALDVDAELAHGTLLPRRQSIGTPRGRGPRGNAASMRATSAASRRSASAPALSSTWTARAALGMVTTIGSRTRKRSATWRGVAPWRRATSARTRPPGLAGLGKSPEPKGL